MTVPEKSSHILHIQKSISFIGDPADIIKIVLKYQLLNLKDSKSGKILHVDKTGYHIAQNFGSGKFWWSWRIYLSQPKFSPPNFST